MENFAVLTYLDPWATAAMQGLLIARAQKAAPLTDGDMRELAKCAYDIAEAMMAERQYRPKYVY